MVKGKGNNLHADNVKVIPSLNLAEFNVIDADSYGVPFNQMYEVFNNPTLKRGTVIIYTCNTNKVSMMNKKCLEYFGLSSIYKKVKTLVNSKTMDLFYSYLHDNGVEYVYEYSEKDTFIKKRGYFIY